MRAGHSGGVGGGERGEREGRGLKNIFLELSPSLSSILHKPLNSDSVMGFLNPVFHDSSPSGPIIHLLKYFAYCFDFAEIFASAINTAKCH